MSDPYTDLSRALSAFTAQTGGTDDQRVATTALIYATLHHAFVELKRALRREDIDATVEEWTTHVELSVQGCKVDVDRLCGRDELTITFAGFATGVIRPAQRITTIRPPYLSSVQVTDFVRVGMIEINRAVHNEISTRAVQAAR